MHENQISGVILDGAIRVHQALGPGLLESVYRVALAHALTARGLKVRREVPVPVTYEGMALGEGFRIDLFVNDKVIVEVKSVVRLHPVHRMQLLTYLRLTGCRLGLLINFTQVRLIEGYERIVNGLTD